MTFVDIYKDTVEITKQIVGGKASHGEDINSAYLASIISTTYNALKEIYQDFNSIDDSEDQDEPWLP